VSRCTLSAALTLAVSALALALVSLAFAGHHHGGKTITCRGPGSMSGYFDLGDRRKVTVKHAKCGIARSVVKHFPQSCSDAYAAQGSCKVRASARWRCRSRLVGSASDDFPSKEVCRHHKSRVRFKVTYSFDPEPAVLPPKTRAPYNVSKNCIDTSNAGTVIPPPDPVAGSFEIHLLGGLPTSVGRGLQEALVAHHVTSILHAGLGSQTRDSPGRIPIFLIPNSIAPGESWGGVTDDTCANGARDAIVITTKQPDFPQQLEKVAAHELFHAYSFDGIAVANGYGGPVPWWEESSANWAVTKVGFPEPKEADALWLQVPNEALDSTENGHQYAMWRFVQWLGDRGLIGGDPAWPLQRQVIGGYASPGATFALFDSIPKQNSSTSLGAELAAFWGDRLKAKPLHGDQLVPTTANANQIEIVPGVTDIPTTAERLHTKLFDFTIAKNVERVTFEFDPPDDGYFWGLVKSNESQRFRKDDSVSFCVGGGDPDTLEWPGHFPVTFTNGSLSTGSIEGKITVRASKDAGQCQLPTPDNRACQLLRDAGVNQLLGAGTFPFDSQDQDSQSKTWICFYTGDSAEVDLNLIRALKLSAKQVRENAKKQIDKLGLDRVKGVGDIAGIGRDTADGKTYNIVVFAVAKEVALFTLSRADDQKAITLAKRLAGQLD
jgi:hypothetical protein